jgi:sialate O-acetylesterase
VRKATMATVLLAGLAVWQTPRAAAEVKLHGLFQDHMVLQRDMKVPIWGTADPGEMVKVTMNVDGQKTSAAATTTADDKGKWMVTLHPMTAGGPITVKVEGKANNIQLTDVLVGEVWICSGQSNMEWSLQQTRDPKDVIANSKNDKIRLFDVPKKPNATPQTELGAASTEKNGREFGKWLECEPKTVPTFSGVGYFFGRKLEKDLKVPVGLINSSWGGTAAERWTSKAVMENNPELKGAKGSDLYNGMIVPLEPFAFRGVIWYQGESNAAKPKQYFHLMNAMIKNWRDDWKQGDFPFLTVQLAPWEPGGNWPELREAQLYTSLKVPNSAMAVITDGGDPAAPKDIHPKDKAIVGERLALAAEALACGKKVEFIGPQFSGVKFEGDKAILTFKHIGGGLKAKGDVLTGFTIAGKDGKFVKGEATIMENTVVVRSPEVAQPTAVRYGWSAVPVCNLYNAEGLPASPFRTDLPDYLTQ